ncbi:MAG: efflux RND transporter periplasmic adaptor subunit [Pseudomonadota bacterium]
MNRHNEGKVLWVLLASLGMIGGALFIVITLFGMRPKPEQRALAVAAMAVNTVTAEQASGSFEISAQGTVKPVTETRLAAEVSGVVLEISEKFVAGGFFEAGEVLARIDPSDYQAALLQAEAELAGASARLADERARSEQAARDWERLNGRDRSPSDLVLRLPQVAEAEASVQAAEAGVMRARRNLERTEIQLPYSGLVRTRDVDLGQYVAPGSPLGTTFSVQTAEVRLPLSNQDLAFLELPAPGQSDAWRPPVQLSGEVAGQRGEWTGRVIRTEGVVDENTRLSYAVVEIDDPYNLSRRAWNNPLQIGTFVQARIEGRDATGLILLPRSALRSGDRVYVADADGKLAVREVDVIRSTPDEVYLLGNVAEGDQIITTTISAPIPGLPVDIQPSATSTDPELRVLPASGELAVTPTS